MFIIFFQIPADSGLICFLTQLIWELFSRITISVSLLRQCSPWSDPFSEHQTIKQHHRAQLFILIINCYHGSWHGNGQDLDIGHLGSHP